MSLAGRIAFQLSLAACTSSALSAPPAAPAPASKTNADAPAVPAAPVPTSVAPGPALETATPAAAPPPAVAANVPAAQNAAQAYDRALAARKLGASESLTRARLLEELAQAETKLLDGRRDEVIADLVYIVEAQRFAPFAASDEGRGARFYLGEALGRAGVYAPAVTYLRALLSGAPEEVWYRRAVRSLVDFGLESAQPKPFLEALTLVPTGAPPELRGDIAYLRGRAFEWAGQRERAFAEYARVEPTARFWAQATYLSGLLAVERGRLKDGEKLFCKVADPKHTPPGAANFGGNNFFRVRDLARLGLGRVAHEQFRFDDARYYYFLVPKDSDHLPEALYETATTRYEAKDYSGARESMDELRALDRRHMYEDEAWILDAYIDLAVCQFPRADASLRKFLKNYEPVRDAARRLMTDPAAVKRLVGSVQRGIDPASAGLGVSATTARSLGGLLRVDLSYGQAARRAAQLEQQLNGLKGAMQALDEARRALGATGEVKAGSTRLARPAAGHAGTAGLADPTLDDAARLSAQLEEVRRLLREAATGAGATPTKLAPLQEQLEVLELRFNAERSRAATRDLSAPAGEKLEDLIDADRKRATELYAAGQKLRQAVELQEIRFAQDALSRLNARLSRLLARARLGRIETVLGKKRALEMEVEALSQGLLPHTIVDSLDAARYLRDDEEYWPFDGEDWEDEYVGGEGLEK